MIQINWRRGLKWFALSLVGFALLGGGEKLYHASEQRNPQYNYQPAANPGVRVFRSSKSHAPAYEPACQNPRGDKDADLCAQWAAVDQVSESNRLTSWNLKLGIFALIFTMVGTGLLVWTFREQRLTSRAELRAYVFPDSVGVYLLREQKPATENGKIGSTILIKNSGQTPAYKLVHWCGLAFHAQASESDLVLPPLSNIGEIGVPPTGTFHAHRRLEIKLTTKDIRLLVNGTMALYVYGRIEYFDAFGDRHYTNYRYAYAGWPLPENLTMNIAHGGNDAD